MNKRQRKKQLRKYGRTWVNVSFLSDGMGGGSASRRNIDNLTVQRDTRDNRNLVTVELDGELIFSYDSNFEGKYSMMNNIQTPMKG